MSDSYLSKRGKRVMVCVRGVCSPSETGHRLEEKLQALIAEHGLDDPDHPNHVRCTVTNCLAVCDEGPVLMVHPGATRYRRVDEAALEQIFQRHLLNDEPVEEYVYAHIGSQPSDRESTRRKGPNRRHREQEAKS